MIGTVEHIKRVMVTLEAGDPRPDLQTPMAAFYVVPERLVIEYDDRPDAPEGKAGTLLRTVKITVHGERWRRLKDRVKEAGSATMNFYDDQYPDALVKIVRDAWWLK